MKSLSALGAFFAAASVLVAPFEKAEAEYVGSIFPAAMVEYAAASGLVLSEGACEVGNRKVLMIVNPVSGHGLKFKVKCWIS